MLRTKRLPRRPGLRTFLLPTLIAGGAIPSVAASPRAPVPGGDSYPAETVYSVALHTHGSMSEQFASWEWHAWKASQAGVDVVWWTDHDWRMTNWRHTNQVNFEAAFWQPESTRWAEPDVQYAGEYVYWQADPVNDFLVSDVVDTLASQGTRSLRLAANPALPVPTFRAGRLEQTASAVQNKHSLAKRIRLQFSVFPEDLDAVDARFVLQTELSDHPEGTHLLRYVVGTMDGEGVNSIPLPYTVGQWNTYEVDVTADAIQRFTAGGADTLRGEDDNLASVKIGLETRYAKNAVVFFDDYHIVTDPSRVGDALLDRAREMSSYYEQMYPGVKGFQGSEISRYKAQPHLNAFAPDHVLVDYTGHDWPDSLYYAIDQVHAQGGAVSLNHTFGPTFSYQFDPNETPEHQAERLLWTKRSLVRCRVLGVDILEVGYRRRGGMDLVHHLDLWDTLLGNAIWITGDGVTDSHGRGNVNLYGWGPSEFGQPTLNNFVTWLAAEELSETAFVRALKGGRAFFGDPYRWDGTLEMRTLDGFRMGQVVVTDRDQHDLAVEVSDVPADVKVRLKQGEIRESPGTFYDDVNFLRDELLSGAVVDRVFRDTVSVDTTVPSYLRLEVTRADDGELVYGNPIHFVRTVPEPGVPAERVAVRIGDVRVFRAEEFTLRDVQLDGSPVLTLTGDETSPGAGTILADPGLLGAPAAVNGATAWSYDAGVLTLTGFSGSGSVVQVVWDGTGRPDVAAGAPALRLGMPRPNPFDGSTRLDYAIPAEGWVRVDVLDVTGRRVRTLRAAFEKAGTRTVVWDGRDEGGQEVAAGVYWVRLEHDGGTVRRKVARLR